MSSPSAGTRQIVIVGGGIIGVCAAYYLLHSDAASAPPFTVTLVEEAHVAAGASGKAGGFLALDWHGEATQSLADLSFRLHKELADDHGGGQRWGYRPMNSISLKLNETSSRWPLSLLAGREHEHEEPQGNIALAQVEFRPRPEERYAQVDSAWCNSGPRSVLGTTETTAQVHPELFTQAMFEMAMDRGLRYIQGRPRKLYRSESSLPESLDITSTVVDNAASQNIPCTDLILAAGPWTAIVARDLGIAPSLPISYLPGHSIIIQPSQPVSATAVFADIYGAKSRPGEPITESPELFPRPDGTVYFAGDNDNDGVPLPKNAEAVDEWVDNKVIDRLVRAAAVVSDRLKAGTILKKQLCYRPTTPDGKPIIDKIEKKIWMASGHGPWGISLSTGTGKVMAEMVVDGKAVSADVSGLGLTRFT